MDKSQVVLVENNYGKLTIENDVPDYLSGIFIHWEIYEWTPSAVKFYKKVWNETIAKKLLTKFNNIYAIPPSPKEEKLISMFDMKDTGLLVRGNKLYVYIPKTHQNCV